MLRIMLKAPAEMVEYVVEVGIMRGQALLCFVIALVKFTMIYFFGTKNVSCHSAHLKHYTWTVCSTLQFSSVNFSKAIVFRSS